MRKENHIEVSDGDTIIVASKKCPLFDKDIPNEQIFNDVICCNIQGQSPNHPNFICPKFYKVIYGTKGFQIDCR